MKAKVHSSIVDRIVDYYLPVDQPNLDFKLNDPPIWDSLSINFRKASERMKRKPIAKKDDFGYVDLYIGQVVLNPVQA